SPRGAGYSSTSAQLNSTHPGVLCWLTPPSPGHSLGKGRSKHSVLTCGVRALSPGPRRASPLSPSLRGACVLFIKFISTRNSFSKARLILVRIHTFQAVPRIPERLGRLRELAYNFWWSFSPDALELFAR